MGKNGGKLEDEIDALFRLPVAEFTGARNALAARLKKEGLKNESDRVKLLSKPSVTAWAVNQLHWEHREAFDELIAASKRIHSGKAAHMRDSLDARREALVHLSDLATELLQDAGHNPGIDTLRRITSTLEALSTYALLPDGPTPGRLTNDVDPPSFELLASLMSGGGTAASSRTKPVKATTQVDRNVAEERRLEETRQARIAAAKVDLQDAKRAVNDARARAESLEVSHKKASSDAKEAEKNRREAATRLEKATAVAEAAARLAERVATETDEATKALSEAKRAVERATKELEALLKEPPSGY